MTVEMGRTKKTVASLLVLLVNCPDSAVQRNFSFRWAIGGVLMGHVITR